MPAIGPSRHFAVTHHFVAYWSNNGPRAILARDGQLRARELHPLAPSLGFDRHQFFEVSRHERQWIALAPFAAKADTLRAAARFIAERRA